MIDPTVETFTCTTCGFQFEASEKPTECPKCRARGSAWTFPSGKTLAIARQNDSFRAGLVVGGCPFPGTVVVTSGVRDRPGLRDECDPRRRLRHRVFRGQ